MQQTLEDWGALTHSHCGSLRAHFAGLVPARAHDVCDDFTDEKVSCVLHSHISSSSALGGLNWSDTKGMSGNGTALKMDWVRFALPLHEESLDEAKTRSPFTGLLKLTFQNETMDRGKGLLLISQHIELEMQYQYVMWVQWRGQMGVPYLI